MRVRSLDDYRMRFEGKDEPQHEHFCLSKNVALFFQNGGETAWVISVSSRREALKRWPSEPVQASELIKAIRTIDSRLGFSLIAIPELIYINATHFDKIAIELDQLCAMTNCFALLELRAETDWKTEILRLRNSLAWKSKITGFSALYGPSELTSDGKTSSIIGAVGGAIQKNDRLRGIWKAPANITISGIQSLNSDLKSAELTHWTGGRTDINVNPIIQLNGSPTIWGSRTSKSNGAFLYIPVQRTYSLIRQTLVSYLEKYNGFHNNTAIWSLIEKGVEDYLNVYWRSGALSGAKSQHAYYIQIGLGKTMTQQDLLEGRVVLEVGLSFLKPTQFTVLRISHLLR